MKWFPLHLQCKVTKSRPPFILNLICYRAKFLLVAFFYRFYPSTRQSNIGISLKTLYASTSFGTTSYPKKYMHAPRAVHACTFFNDNVNDDVNDFVIVEKHTSRSLVIVFVNVNVLGELRFAKILKYQPHLIAGEVA